MAILTQGDKVGDKIGNPVQLSESDMQPLEKTKVQNADKMDKMDTAPPPAKKPMLSNMSSNNMNVSLNEQMTHPIASLSPYQNKWVIKARVTNKSAVRTWSNSKGDGKLFSFDLMDESGEIRATAFKEMCDKYYDVIQIDKVYYISKCQLKMANKQFTTLKNDYEMTLNENSIIQECLDSIDNIPTTQYCFVSIDKIAQMEVNSVVDVIGIVKAASDVQAFTAKSSKRELKKRELTIVDSSKSSITLTLWGEDAVNYNQTNQTPVVVIKDARVGEFGGGKNITYAIGCIAKYNPDMPEAFAMRGWYDNGGDRDEVNNISARSGVGTFESIWMNFKETKDQGLGNSDRGDYYQTKGTVLLIKSDNSTYKACPTENCNKKVIDLENGQYRCEKCNAEFPEFKYRLLGNVNIGDWTSNRWVSMFTPEAEKILGITAQEYGEAGAENKENLANICRAAHFKQFIFKMRAKIEAYNDEARLKTVAVRVDPINYKEYNSHLISQIQQYTS